MVHTQDRQTHAHSERERERESEREREREHERKRESKRERERERESERAQESKRLGAWWSTLKTVKACSRSSIYPAFASTKGSSCRCANITARCKEEPRHLFCQFLYFCTSKASKLGRYTSYAPRFTSSISPVSFSVLLY